MCASRSVSWLGLSYVIRCTFGCVCVTLMAVANMTFPPPTISHEQVRSAASRALCRLGPRRIAGLGTPGIGPSEGGASLRILCEDALRRVGPVDGGLGSASRRTSKGKASVDARPAPVYSSGDVALVETLATVCR
jgi:hypothetical protein